MLIINSRNIRSQIKTKNSMEYIKKYYMPKQSQQNKFN